MADIIFIIPASMYDRPEGQAEIDRRTGILRKITGNAHTINIVDVPDAPAYLTSTEAVEQSVRGTIKRLKEAQENACDVGIIGCMVNPGLNTARAAVEIPVIGGAEASFIAAATQKKRFSVLTPYADNQCEELVEQLVQDAGCSDYLASVRSILSDTDNKTTDAKLLAAGRLAVEKDGAEILILGAMLWSFQSLPDEISARLGVQVINSVQCSVAAAIESIDSKAK